MVSASLYVEGGGDSKSLKTACRRGFRKFIENAGAAGGVSNIVACGSRGNAYRSFSKALSASVNALLLVDAEGSVTAQGSVAVPQGQRQLGPPRHRNGRPMSPDGAGNGILVSG